MAEGCTHRHWVPALMDALREVATLALPLRAGTQQASLHARNPFTQWEEAAIVCLHSLELSDQYGAISVFMHPGKGHRAGDSSHTVASHQSWVIMKGRGVGLQAPF